MFDVEAIKVEIVKLPDYEFTLLDSFIMLIN